MADERSERADDGREEEDYGLDPDLIAGIVAAAAEGDGAPQAEILSEPARAVRA